MWVKVYLTTGQTSWQYPLDENWFDLKSITITRLDSKQDIHMRILKILLLSLTVFVCLNRLLPVSTVHSQSGDSGLSAPTGVIASDNSYTLKVGISWDAIRNARSYRIFRNTSNDPLSAIELGATAAATFFDTTALAGQTYFYWVRAENGNSLSPMSTADQGSRAIGGAGQGQALNPPPEPGGNPVTAAKAYLGKALFWDEQLSSTRTVSCGTCHIVANGGADPRSKLASTRAIHPGADNLFGTSDDVVGSPGVPANNADGSYSFSTLFGLNEQVTGRRGVSYIDAGYSNSLFWDGRATQVCTDPITNTVVLTSGAALESQVLGPPISNTEMAHANRNWNDVALRVAESKPLALASNLPRALENWINRRSYPELFTEAFGTSEVTPTRIAMAIATYERTLYSDRTPFDANVQGIASLTPAEQRGLGVFNQSRCDNCHRAPLFTDNNFHYTGVRPTSEDTGRFQVTGNANDLGEFRTPTLRNIELRAPYMHNGRFATLEEVVEFYNRGGDFDAPNKNRNVRPLNLTSQQKADLVAFLKRPLTDPRVAAQTVPFDRPTLYTESSKVPQIIGTGTQGSNGSIPQVIAIEPPLAGNPRFTVAIYNARANAQAVLVIDENEPPAGSIVPTSASFARLSIQLASSSDGKGFGSVSLAIPENDSELIGKTLFGRWYVFDSGAANGVAVTPAFRLTIFGLATGSSPSNVQISVASVTGKNLFVSGTGFERGDVLEINGQQAIVTKFVDGNTLNAKKGARLLLPCDAGNPTRTNILKLIRVSNGNAVTIASKEIGSCP
jgi:cytochrome c peroxidase